jgi:hypothetical protein
MIILHLRQTSSARIEGDMSFRGSGIREPFEGILELIGLLESFLALPQSSVIPQETSR